MNKQDSIEMLKRPLASAAYFIQLALNIRPKGMCLVTGCPRSGTTAMLAWLHSNKEVARFFETRILISAHRFYSEAERFQDLTHDMDYLTTEIRKLVMKHYASRKLIFRKQLVEKEPLEPIAFPDEDYASFLSNVRKMFPDMKLLFMIRNPINTIWSMMNRKWGYSLASNQLRRFTLKECIRTWNTCASLALQYTREKNVFLCQFEGLIEEPLKTSTQILRFLGLQYCPAFETRQTKTAGFGESDRQTIHRETSDQMDAINRFFAFRTKDLHSL